MFATVTTNQALASPPAATEGTGRTLAGHRFVVPQARYSTFENPQFPSPFATTDFALLVGMGYGSVEIDDPEVVSALQQVRRRPEIDLVTLTLGVNFQVAIGDHWAVRVEGAGSLLSGANDVSLLAPGVYAGFAGGTGATATAKIGEHVRVSGAFDFGYDKELHVTPLGLVESILGRSYRLDDLLTTTDDYTFRETAQAAFAIHESLGAVTRFQFEQGISVIEDEPDERTRRFSLSPALDFDLGALVPVPIGIFASYSLAIPIDPPDETGLLHVFGGGLSYTGRADLILAAELQTAVWDLEDLDVTGYDGLLRMQYFW